METIAIPASQRVFQICLFLVAAIALIGGPLQRVLGQPDTLPRLDNVHRFMAGVYFGCGIIALWAAITVRQRGTLVDLIALTVVMAAVGRLVSMAKVGVPEPNLLWLGYLAPELVVPCVLVLAHRAAGHSAQG